MTIQLNTPLSALMWATIFATGCAYGAGDATDEEGPFLAREEPRVDDEAPSWAAPADDMLLEGELPPPRILGESEACHLIVDGYHARGLEIG